MQLRRPALQPGTIPRGSYRGFPALPETDLPTVAVQRLLVARGDLEEEIAAKLTRVLFERRRELMNLTALAGFITPPNLGGGTYIPVHPGAQSFYDRDSPSFIQENAEPLALVVTLAALMVSGLLQLGSRRRKRRIDRYNKEVLDLGVSLDRSSDLNDVRRCRERLFDLAAGVVDDAEIGLIIPEGFNFFWFTWSMVNGRLEKRESPTRIRTGRSVGPAKSGCCRRNGSSGRGSSAVNPGRRRDPTIGGGRPRGADADRGPLRGLRPRRSARCRQNPS